MKSLLSTVFVIALTLVLTTESSYATEQVVLAQTKIVKSTVLGEQRTIHISLPRGYDDSGKTRYPVIYTLDGNHHLRMVSGTVDWLSTRARKIPSSIVVAIPNVDRFRDMTPTQAKNNTRKGAGAAKFLQFISDELIPYVDKNYPTRDVRVLSGHSLAGQFTLYALLEKPTLFNGYIAHSPWVRYDDMALIKRAKKVLPTFQNIDRFVFMSIGYEPALIKSYEQMANLLASAPKGLVSYSQTYELEDHMSTPSLTMHNALSAFSNYYGWTISPEVSNQGLAAIKTFFKNAEKRQGKSLKIPENVLNDSGYALLLGSNKINEAIEVFEFANKLYPNSSNTYDSLAEAYEAAGRLIDAKAKLETGVKVATEQKARDLPLLQAHLKAVLEKLAKS